MDCLAFRRVCGTEPQNNDPEYRAHLQECDACAAYASETAAFDELLTRAVRIEAPTDLFRRREAEPVEEPVTRQWWALAASVVIGLGIASGVWLSTNTASLAEAVAQHYYHESQSLHATNPVVEPAVLDAVLRKVGVTVDSEFGAVTYARICNVHGHKVAHLVIDGEEGPVMVLIMPGEARDTRLPVSHDDLHGKVIPSGKGSIAIVGVKEEPMEALGQRVLKTVEWSI